MRFASVVVLALVLVTTVSAAPWRNYIAAIVNDSVITRQEVEKYTEKSVDVLQRTFFNQPEVLERKYAEAFDEGLQFLLERELILDDFEASKLILPENMIDDEIKNRVRDRFGAVDRPTLTRALHAEGLTYETFRKRVREDLIVRIMVQRNLQAATLISPAKVESYYRDHLEEFKIGEQAKLRMIVLKAGAAGASAEVKKLAEEVHAKIKAGASFAEMAGIHSEGSARRMNGDWGWMERNKLSKGLADVAFALPPQQMSGVIGFASAGTNGYWIYQYDQGQLVSGRNYTSRDAFVEEKKFDNNAAPPIEPQEFYLMLVEARQEPRTRPLAEIQDQIEKDLLVREHERLRKKWIERLKEKAYVRYF